MRCGNEYEGEKTTEKARHERNTKRGRRRGLNWTALIDSERERKHKV